MLVTWECGKCSNTNVYTGEKLVSLERCDNCREESTIVMPETEQEREFKNRFEAEREEREYNKYKFKEVFGKCQDDFT